MRINKTVPIFFIAVMTAQTASAQWVGADGPPVEPSQKNMAFLGEDISAPAVPAEGSALR